MRSRGFFAATGAAVVAAVVVLACGSSSDRGSFESNGGSGNGASGGPNGSSGGFSDGAPATDPNAAHPTAIGWLHGKVVAPEGTIPISDALVYLTSTPPAAIPGAVFCDTCVHLTTNQPYAYSKSDGTFELAAYAEGQQYLVVQKGQFRRVRQLGVTSGDQNVAGELTRLPGKTDAAAGDTIPNIGMYQGAYDAIDLSMKKLGIQEFQVYNGNLNALIGNDAEMAKHHIVLLPCASLGYQANNDDSSNPNDPNYGKTICGAPTAAQKNALNAYVQSGGKLYVTDYAYEAVRQTWPGFITFYDQNMNELANTGDGVGTACRPGGETNPGAPNDKGLGEWMTAIGNASFDLQASYTRIAHVQPQQGIDPSGAQKTITPKVWMSEDVGGMTLPATVSFEQKCGRVLFSTYHCEGDAQSGLLAQEKALLYILLEVGVCVGEMPPPPPPR